MNLYLDDDSASDLLVRLLRRAGHDVQTPAEAGMAGKRDAYHLAHAIDAGRACLSGNHDDFAALHFLMIESGGHHSGILIVRRDNDPTKDMKPPAIVRAIRNLEAAAQPMADRFEVLNHWR